VVILSDTFYEFAMPLMRQLGYPALFCHKLVVDDAGYVRNYILRMPEQKRESVKAFKSLNFKVIAAGDSYNDTAMLAEAHAGILFRPPQNVIDEFPQFPVTLRRTPCRNRQGIGANLMHRRALLHTVGLLPRPSGHHCTRHQFHRRKPAAGS
jgi:phosphoserine/homoserine phosphotransferase